MSQTLLVGKSNKLRDVYAVNLNTYVGTDVIPKQSVQEALEVLKILPSISLIVTVATIDGSQTALELDKYLTNEGLDVPMIVMGKVDELKDSHLMIESETDIKGLISSAAKILGITPKQMLEKVVPDYYPLPTKYFRNIFSSPCDVFVRVKKGATEFQYIKRFKAEEQWKPEDIVAYETKGVSNLYVLAENRLKFVNQMTKSMVDRLNNQSLTVSERIKATEDSMAFVQEQMSIQGLSDETIQLANASMKSVILTAKKEPRLQNLLKRLLENKSGFLFKHCQLITYVTFHIIDHIDWGTEEQKEKLSYVSFFHDITLDTEEQAKIRSDDELFKSKLSTVEREKVNKHALRAGQIIQEMGTTPIGVDIIIRQHHGKRNGIGFTNFYGANISPLAIVFIIAEDFVHMVLESDANKLDIDKIIKKLIIKYPTSHYKKVINTLQKLNL